MRDRQNHVCLQCALVSTDRNRKFILRNTWPSVELKITFNNICPNRQTIDYHRHTCRYCFQRDIILRFIDFLLGKFKV